MVLFPIGPALALLAKLVRLLVLPLSNNVSKSSHATPKFLSLHLNDNFSFVASIIIVKISSLANFFANGIVLMFSFLCHN